jgi:hypothetical protein
MSAIYFGISDGLSHNAYLSKNQQLMSVDLDGLYILKSTLDRKNKLCNLKIKPVGVLRTDMYGFQAPQLRRFFVS